MPRMEPIFARRTRSLANELTLSGGANVAPVVANDKVIVASYRELRVFGVGGTAACGVNIAQMAEQQFAAILSENPPSRGQFVEMKGTIIAVADTKLQLKSGEKTMEVDLTNVLKSGRHELCIRVSRR